MIAKEQIIIHGVDVNECDFFIKNRDKQLCRCIKFNSFGDIVNPKNAENSNCLDNYNCYYKQRVRKTQECEELKRKVELMMDCSDCKVDEYKKALEEIEGLVQNVEADECPYGDFDCNNCDSDNSCPTKVKRLILDIINKAKGK